jgi:hypothetical protein
MRRFTDALEAYLNSWSEGRELFAFYYEPDNKTYLADVRVLKALSDAFDMKQFEGSVSESPAKEVEAQG